MSPTAHPTTAHPTTATPEAVLEINRRLYDHADDPIWTLAVYETVHGGHPFANIGGRTVLDHAAELAGLDPSGRVLEVGCGSGAPAIYLAERFGCRVLGLDLNRRQVGRAVEARDRLAPEVAQRLDFQVRDVLVPLDAPAADTASIEGGPGFDLVFTLDVLMLIPDVGTALRHMARALRPGGWMVLNEILAGPHLDESMRRFAIEEDGMFHLPTAEDYRRWLQDAGLEPVDARGERSEALGIDRTAEAADCFAAILGGLESHRPAIIEAVGAEACSEWVRVSERYRQAFAERRLLYRQILARAPRASAGHVGVGVGVGA